MRIPTSLVVMSCVTALPFGLAIRDTVHGTARGNELDLTGDKARARELRQRDEREQARMEDEYEARLLAREAKLDALYGKTVASRGTLTESTADFDVVNDGDVMTVAIPATDCDRVHRKLVVVWGQPTNDIWLDPTTHRRAAFSDDACTLRFDSYLDPVAWVDQLPFNIIGTTSRYSEWRRPGTGFGRDITHFYSDSDGGAISFNIVSDTDLSTQADIRAALATKLGVPAVQSTDDANVWLYKTKRPVRFDASGASRFSIQIGTPTWQ